MADQENKPSDIITPNIITPKPKNGKPLLIGIVVIVVCILAGAVSYFVYDKSNFVKTDNATVQYDMVTIVSKINGNIQDVKVKQGDYIHKNDVIMDIDPTVADSTQIDNSYIRSTMDGAVLEVVGTQGQAVTAGQTVAYLAHDTKGYIISNLDEKDVNKVKIGQDVDIAIDQFGSQKFYGKVVEIGTATLATFSIIPGTASGTFVKETQYVPVKIQFIKQPDNMLVGANATVTIHIK